MTIPPLTVHDGRLHVHDGQAYVPSPQCDVPAPEDAFAGQVNGLCGAVVPGGLFLVTGAAHRPRRAARAGAPCRAAGRRVVGRGRRGALDDRRPTMKNAKKR